MIQFLRFGVIVLGTIMIGLLFFIAVARLSKGAASSASTWSSNVIVSIMLTAGLLGAGIGFADSLIFNPVTDTVIIPSSGIMLVGEVDFGIYWDVTATSKVTRVEWGDLQPGDVGVVEFWIRNEGNSDLYCDTGTDVWVPSGSEQYFDLTWNFGDTPIRQYRPRKVVMELHVHSDITGIHEFTFDIIVYGDTVPFIS